ncbi:uncharacterized protein LOC104673980 [Rhinopithecus roxellana]|uniref:uncharacterized protein LOC104673980 n=1 Tax=Rhinopithecus roxellana TaxID=61622 RepID=UPI0012371AD2|nr:uncharacterized protein LOC104673980 [Rhinopithecus roxellana]
MKQFCKKRMNFLHHPDLYLRVRRSHLVKDALRQLSQAEATDFRKVLVVEFIEEIHPESGGVSSEFFHCMFEEMTKPEYGMFMYPEMGSCMWFPAKAVDLLCCDDSLDRWSQCFLSPRTTKCRQDMPTSPGLFPSSPSFFHLPSWSPASVTFPDPYAHPSKHTQVVGLHCRRGCHSCKAHLICLVTNKCVKCTLPFSVSLFYVSLKGKTIKLNGENLII